MAALPRLDALLRGGRSLAISSMMCALAACQAGTGPTAPDSWISPFGRDHALAGRIWNVAEDRFTDIGSMVADLETARFVLAGEKHDNPDHHLIQAWLIDELIRRGRPPVTAFEMFTTEQQAALDAFRKDGPADASGFDDALNWSQSGWPAWSMYRPVVEAALSSGQPLLAASMPRSILRSIVSEGTAALGAAEVGRLGLAAPLPEPLADRLREEIVESHCRMLPDTMVGPMATVLATRDAFMAHVLIDSLAQGDGVTVLIAGGGHARTDIAVPWHLGRARPEDRIVSIGLVEVSPGLSDPGSYAARFRSARLPFDYAWFTARADNADPCEKYADQLKRMKHGERTQ